MTRFRTEAVLHHGVLFACVFASPVSIPAYSVYLRSQAPVTSGDVRLKDIARVEGESRAGAISDKMVVRSLKAPLFLSREAIAEGLKAGPEKLDWVYGSGVWIVPLSRKATPEELMGLLKKQIAGMPGGPEFLRTAVFRADGSAHYQIPPEGDVQFQLPSRIAHLKAGRRLMILAVRGRSRGRDQVVHRIHFGFTLLRKQKVAVATRPLHPGNRLGADDWEYREVESDEIPGRPLSGDLTGRRITGAVDAGAVLSDSVLRDIPAVRVGQKVQLIYQSGRVVLKCDSVAEGTGEVGTTLRFRPLLPSGRRGRSVEARVVGDGLAQLAVEGGGAHRQ